MGKNRNRVKTLRTAIMNDNENQTQGHPEDQAPVPGVIDVGIQDGSGQAGSDALTSEQEPSQETGSDTGDAPVQDSSISGTSTEVINKEAPPLEEFEAFVKQVAEIDSKHIQSLVSSINDYVKGMKPGLIMDPNTGARNQYWFWKAIVTAVENTPDEEFRRMWNILLAYFNQYKNDVFGVRYVYRFSEHWNQSEDDLNAYQRILNLIILTCDPETRSTGLKQVDLDRTLDKIFTETGRQRVIGFYK